MNILEKEIRIIGSEELWEVYTTITEEIREKGKIEGEAKGKREGKIEGIRIGKLEGEIKAKQYVLLRLLDKKFDSVDEVEKEKIINVRDRDKLGRAIDLILDAKSIEEVLRPLN
jgi:predicted transposase YdaD